MKAEYLRFTDEMIPEAAKLLAARHARHRKALPLLPARFEDPTIAAQTVDRLWQQKLKNGFVACRAGKLIAYLIGETTTQSWGRSGYVYLAGYALAENESPAVLQDLYALLGDEWVKTGHFNHYLYICAADQDILHALFDIGFGKERTDALLQLNTLDIPQRPEPDGVEIRQAGSGDNILTGSFSNLIFRALANAPYWHPTLPEDWNDLYEGWSELADDKEWTVWLALEQTEAIGMIGFRKQEEADDDLLVPPQTTYLSVAATKLSARGRGIQTALTWHGLKQAQQTGYQICYTNWISPNFLASRFWPRFGFQDAAYRLAKKVNPMIAWARTE